MESHVQSAVKLHLDLACVKLNDTEVKLNATQGKLNDTEEKTTRLMKKLDNLQRRFEERNISHEIVMAKSESLKFTRTFLWKVDNLTAWWQVNTVIHRLVSTPFYTERYGYKLRLSIIPSGIASGKNTHLSVFLIVMKGQYDAILTWPFKKAVKFTLIDQQEDPVERKNVSLRIRTDDVLKGNFDRPITEENGGWGFPEFISHKKLHSRRYIVDDTLFLQFEVDP